MALLQFEKIQPFEAVAKATASESLSGKYAVKGPNKSIEATNSNVLSEEWFHTPPLTSTIINQLTSIQLFTNSRDQGWANDSSAGNWTWYELEISHYIKKDSLATRELPDGQLLMWRSHKNRFLSSDYALTKGRLFTRNNDLLDLLQPGDVISVRICARFNKWKNDAKSGYLVIGLGSEPFYRDPIDLSLRKAHSIVAFGQKRNECLMLPINGSPENSYATTVVHGGVDLLSRLLESEDNNWSVSSHPLKATSPANGETSSGPRSLEFDSVFELAESKTQTGVTLFAAKESTLRENLTEKVSSKNDIPSQPQQLPTKSKIVILSEVGVAKDNVDNMKMLESLEAELLIYQMSAPLWKGELWKVASKGPKYRGQRRQDRLVVIIDADDLRAEGMQISCQLSWEKTMEDIRTHFAGHVAELQQSRMHLIIRCGYEGVFYLTSGSNFICYMVPDKAEGELLQSHNNMVPGLDMAFVSGLAASLVDESEMSLDILGATQIESAIKLALTWSHRFASIGFHKDKEGHVNYPNAKDVNTDTKSEISVIHCGREWMGNDGSWSIFNILQRNKMQFAANLVRRTPEEIISLVPTARFGKLLTADRIEIECFRATAAVIDEYLHSNVTNPMSIAVFGPPGSGKSFGVKEVIQAVTKGRGKNCALHEVNLSQFLEYSDLVTTFHSIKDISLSGNIPVVLFDEFDCYYKQKLGWLKYFLAPMQDGQFLDTGLNRPLGRAIFVFIGGISSTFKSFVEHIDNEEAKQAKKPDFVSRLRGYIDIRGPNQNEKGDKMYPIRRAMLFRNLLERRLGADNKEIDVDERVLKAFLEYPILRHGARSLDLILQMSRLSGRKRFDASALPADNQLSMHVDIDDFKEGMAGPIPGTDLRQIDSSLRAINRPMQVDHGLSG